VTVEHFACLADGLAEPFSDHRAADVVVIDPVLVAGVVQFSGGTAGSD
jgi:hypothetical protein